MLIPNPDLDFWNFDPKIHFWANLGPKIQSCPFCLKIGTHGISRMLILIPTLVFWISNPNFLFRPIWAGNTKVVRFNWKLAHMVSRGCWFLFQHVFSYWFLFQHLFSQFRTKDPFLAKFGPKRSNLSILPEIGTLGILRMWILIPRLVFWILKAKSS